MGSASRVIPGRPHNDSLAASLPIENSPPGIHTMPAGAGAGAGVVLGIVGAKGDDGAASLPPCPAGAEGGERYLTRATPPARTATAMMTQRSGPGREGRRVFFAAGRRVFGLPMALLSLGLIPLQRFVRFRRKRIQA